jgi:hypothetical protein
VTAVAEAAGLVVAVGADCGVVGEDCAVVAVAAAAVVGESAAAPLLDVAVGVAALPPEQAAPTARTIKRTNLSSSGVSRVASR